MVITEASAFYDGDVAVFGGPARYIQGPGSLCRLGRIAAGIGDRGLVVTDNVIRRLYGAEIERLLREAGLEVEFLVFSGDLLEETAAQLVGGIKPRAGDVVIACGGGRAIDTGKAVVALLKAPLITVPTVASNDAPTSKNYVIYDEDHFLTAVGHLARNPDYVLVDTRIVNLAPKELFAAGLGDALSKLIEARACARAGGVNMYRARPTRLASAVARACEETLLNFGADALDVAGSGKVTPAFEATVEALILMAGLAFENGGLSIAHALTRGLPHVPGVGERLHGFQVAYGIVVQKALEEEPLDPRMLTLMRKAGLPVTLRELCGRAASQADFERIADGTMGVAHLKNFPSEVTRDGLVAAMARIEAQADAQERVAAR